MERKYKKLQEIVEKSEENARVHEHKAWKVTEGYTKVIGENENLYIANKKLWVQVKDTKIRCFFGTLRRKGEASQKESNHWQTQAIKAQTKVGYWKNEHSVIFEELIRCRKSRKHWKRKAEAKKVQYQEVLKEKIALQKVIQVLEYQLLQQGGRINQVLSDQRNNDENQRKMYKQVANSNVWLSTQSRGEQMYIDHITIQVWKIVHEFRRMSKKRQALIMEYYLQGNLGQRIQDFLEEVKGQYKQITRFYEANLDVLNFQMHSLLMYLFYCCNRLRI